MFVIEFHEEKWIDEGIASTESNVIFFQGVPTPERIRKVTWIERCLNLISEDRCR